MKYIDIISQSPKNFIFQKESNKTNFGGIFSLIYFILILVIFLIYATIFLLNETYEITSFISQGRGLDDDELKKIAQSEKYNPTLKIKFSLVSYQGIEKELSERFILYDLKQKKQVKRDEIMERRISEISFAVLYQCKNNETDCEVEEEDYKSYYQLIFWHNGFAIRPQEEIPIFKKDTFNADAIAFNPDIQFYLFYQWDIIRYEDSKGLLQLFDIFKEKEGYNTKENDIYIGGKLKKHYSFLISQDSYSVDRHYRLLFRFNVLGPHNSNTFLYEDFKRKKKSFLDSIANIFSLWMSLYNGISFIFEMVYSKNFDKYKIIENIISKGNKHLINNLNEKQKPKFVMKDININTNKGETLLENEFCEKPINEEDNILNDDDDIYNVNFSNLQDQEGRTLPKLRFIDFIFNNIYCEKICKYRKKQQQLISTCNDIIFKYFSIENVLYNQFMIENLIKDYKWNNPKLKEIINNEIFNKIKTLLNE